MKKYLVTENNVSSHPTVEHWAETSREELSPDARVLTREQILAVHRKFAEDNWTGYMGELDPYLDEIFGAKP